MSSDYLEGKLTEIQVTAACLLATGMGRSAVAAEIQVRRETIYHWLNNPDFTGYIRELQAEAREAARSKLLGMANAALNTLKDIVEDKNESAAARVSACGKIIGFILGETNHIDEHDIPKNASTLSKREALKRANALVKEVYGLSEAGDKS